MNDIILQSMTESEDLESEEDYFSSIEEIKTDSEKLEKEENL